MRLALRSVLLFFVVSWMVGCHPGYRSVSKLERENRGPEACTKRCGELGMKMGAFALIDTVHSGCICVPSDAAAAAPAAPAVAPLPAPEALPSAPAAPAPAGQPAPESAPATPPPSAQNPAITGALAVVSAGMLIDDEAKGKDQPSTNAQRAQQRR